MVESIDRESVPGRSLSGPDDRLREPEGRRRQDHDGGQPRELSARSRASGSSSSTSTARETPRAASGSTGPRSSVRSTTRSIDECRWRRSSGRGPTRRSTSSRRPIALAGAEVELAHVEARERRLVDASSQDVADRYDYIFIDCPPSLGLLTVNALTAADAVLIPLQCEYYALEGLTQLLATIDLIRDHLNPDARARGRPPDDVRRPDEPVGRRRRRGATPLGPSVFDTVDPAQRASVRGAEPRPADRDYGPTRAGAIAYRALAPRSSGVARRTRRPSVERSAQSWPSDRRRRIRRAPSVSWWRMTVRPDRPASLGRGLASLIPQRSAGHAGHRGDPDGADPPEPVPAAQAHRRCGRLATLTASVAEHGVIQPILVTEIARRLPARRRRAPTSRRRRGRPRPHPGGRPAARRPRPARARARREPAARGPRPDRGGLGLSPAHR